MIKFVVESEQFSMVVGKDRNLKKNYYFFRDKSPLEGVKVRNFKSKIALGVQYTPCDHEGLTSRTECFLLYLSILRLRLEWLIQSRDFTSMSRKRTLRRGRIKEIRTYLFFLLVIRNTSTEKS